MRTRIAVALLAIVIPCAAWSAPKGSSGPAASPSTEDVEARIAALVKEADEWWHKGNYPEIIRCDEEILKLDPTWVDMYSNIAWLQWSMGQDLVALHTLHRGIAANRNSSEAWFNMGFHRFNIKEYDRAVKYLARAVALGGDKQTRKIYAYALEKVDRNGDALQVWRELLRDFPDDPVIRTQAARAEEAAKGAAGAKP